MLTLVVLSAAALVLLGTGAARRSEPKTDVAGISEHGDDVVFVPGEPAETEVPLCLALPSAPIPKTSDPFSWAVYFGSGGCQILPPEMPSDMSDLGVQGDVDKLPLDLARKVYTALYREEDPGELLILADEVELSGYLIASNRLRRKAFRKIA